VAPERNSSLPFATKKSIALDIARGIAALHDSGVIHGDMKPENVLIFYIPEFHAKITDFIHSFLNTGKRAS
jgi:serine/threonine protein kinase